MLKPNDEYRDAVEVLELALAMGEGSGSGGGRKLSPQKLNDARRVRESLDGLHPPNCEFFSEVGVGRGVEDGVEEGEGAE